MIINEKKSDTLSQRAVRSTERGRVRYHKKGPPEGADGEKGAKPKGKPSKKKVEGRSPSRGCGGMSFQSWRHRRVPDPRRGKRGKLKEATIPRQGKTDGCTSVAEELHPAPEHERLLATQHRKR